MQIDFVKVPYTTWPSMQKLQGPSFNSNPSREYLAAKQQEIIQWGKDLYAITDLGQTLVLAASNACGVKYTENIIDLALQFEEDLAILHNGKLEAICFCFPSSWIPSTRIGMSLSDIHRPVADSDKLVQASNRIASTISDTTLGSFKRHVWTIKSLGDLSNHPGKTVPKPQSIDDLYFRVETQTTLPFYHNSALFFVKVDVIPLIEIFKDIETKKTIIDSVNSMTDAVLDYKNLRDIKNLIQ